MLFLTNITSASNVWWTSFIGWVGASALEPGNSWWESFVRQIEINYIQGNRYMLVVRGLGMTIEITVFAVIVGIILGCVLALMRLSEFKLFGCRIIQNIAAAYIDIIRGTPIVVQITIFYFIILRSVTWPKELIAIIAFGLNSGAYVAEIVRGGILSVDHGQTEAGRSLGLSYAQTMRLIVLPQAVKNIFPSLANEFIVLMKETAVIGYIAGVDLMKAGDIIRSQTYSPFMPLITTAVIYYLIIKAFTLFFGYVERRLRESDNRHRST